MMVGDPLAAPWRPANTLKLEGLPATPISAKSVPITLSVSGEKSFDWGRYSVLINGLLASEIKEPNFQLDTGSLSSGRHTLRVVAHRSGLINHQLFAEQVFTVK